MNKLAQLFNRINKFSNDAYLEYQMIKFAVNSSFLIQKASEFDIKDEELFNQFEAFMSGYEELMKTLNVDAKNLNPENFEDAGELLTTLISRFNRIISNPYLNITENEGWEEDFNPGDFTKFLIDVAQDAENKLKSVAGEDFDISDMKAAQLAKEFNNQTVDKGDKNITWTGDKVRQNLEAKKRWFENLMTLKKLNINHPQYQSYIESRRKTYRDIMSDPEKRSHYREQARIRQFKFTKKLDARKKEIIELLKKENRTVKIHELEQELFEIEGKLNLRKERGREIAKKVKEIRESGNFNGDLFKFNASIANIKMGIKKTVTDKIKENILSNELTTYKPYLDKIKEAKDLGDKELIKQRSKELNDIINMKAINEEAELHPKVIAFIDGAREFNIFKRKLKEIDDSKIMNSSDPLPDTIKERLKEIAAEGTSLANKYNGRQSFTVLVNAVFGLVNHINNRIS